MKFLWRFLCLVLLVLSEVSSAQKETKIIIAAQKIPIYLPLLQSKKVGVVANQSSVIFRSEKPQDYISVVDSLPKLGVNITKIFSPEHGFKGMTDAAVHIANSTDENSKLPVISLYGKHKKPSKEQLQDIDIMVCYLQDVGVRFYTYLSTLHYVMEACGEQNIPVMVLDCPNPNAHYIDGPILQEKCKSFLGLHPIPLVYGMTIGEYAQMIDGEGWLQNGIHCDLTIIPLDNYTHQTPYKLRIPPSPNLPNAQSIALYPSLGLFEGTIISIGRGTSYPFQCWGAPWFKQYEYKYVPVPKKGALRPKFLNEKCYGMDLRIAAPPKSLRIQWLIRAYRYTAKSSFFGKTFDLHAGTPDLQQQIKNGWSEEAIKKTWEQGLADFKKVRARYLLYP